MYQLHHQRHYLYLQVSIHQTGSTLETSLHLLLLIMETDHNNALVSTYLLLVWSLCICFIYSIVIILNVSHMLV